MDTFQSGFSAKYIFKCSFLLYFARGAVLAKNNKQNSKVVSEGIAKTWLPVPTNSGFVLIADRKGQHNLPQFSD